MQSPEQEASDRFRRCLLALAEFTIPPESSVTSELTQQFRESLLLFGSETDDNRECSDHLEIGSIVSNYDRTSFGLRLRHTETAVSTVLWHAEGCPIPEQVSEALPDLTQRQWNTCQRLATLILSAFESTIDGN